MKDSRETALAWARTYHDTGRFYAALARRVKESFDPQGVLNPGRMWAGV